MTMVALKYQQEYMTTNRGWEDFNRAILKVTHVGSLPDYQRMFEKLGNWLDEWTQKELSETCMVGVISPIVDGFQLI